MAFFPLKMKCLLIASESAEVLFHWSDREYRQSIQEKYGVSSNSLFQLPAFEDILSTLFAPIIISCSTLEDSYTSFTTENNHIYVLHQFDECLYIAVNGDGEEKEDDLRRKLYVLKKMVEVMFGMVTLSGNLLRKELRPQDTEQRARLWKYLQSLLDTYSLLRENDQSFLVEAVERLIHPQLCELCIEFLERRLVQQLNSSVERAGEEVLHAFVLVHTKLLAFYSSRNASILTPSDLLALIVMAQNMYPSNVDLDDMSPEVSNGLRLLKQLLVSVTISCFSVKDADSTSGSGPETFYTPEPSPSSRSSSSSGLLEKAGRGETPVFEFVDPEIQMAEDSLHTLEINPPDPASPRRVFLEVLHKDGLYPMMPHSMYCLSLWPGITLVLLTKISSSALAISVYKYLEDFDKLEKRLHEGHGGPASARSPLNMQDIRSKMDKFIKSLEPHDLQYAQLQNVWAEFKSRAFSRAGSGFNKDLIPWCKNMKTQLCGIYRQCFLTDSLSADVTHRLSAGLQERAQAMVREKLVDWKDFLLVKSKRNITMVSYLEDFPGLVHFICVDRATGQMIAPSLSIAERTTSELGKGPVANYIKNKVRQP
uniref:HPS1 biogenesis of lysosomal organelles complex 3 subunit 1 n=1 Tax=Poecilia formosa TaxID=48698 RepID=A0A096LX26_POEFO